MSKPQTIDRKLHETSVYEDIYGSQISNARAAEAIRTDFARNLLHESEEDFLKQVDRLAPGAKVLEIGTGDGRHAIRAARAGGDVTATDISSKSIELTRANSQQAGVSDRIAAKVMDAEALDLPDETFDLIINHEVFSSIDLCRVVPELHRVLKPGGSILIKECLAHNPIFNLNRRINYWLGRRTHWAITHIFSRRDLEFIEQYFSSVVIRPYHLTSVLLAPLQKLLPHSARSGFLAALSAFDRIALRLPGVKWLAFKVVGEISGKKSEIRETVRRL